jgi:3',5'-nucleoside bisphosphate phosphatase
MQFADLHIHSTFSDGSLTPSEILNIAIKNQICCISITDHDTILSQYEIGPNINSIRPRVIPGLEISTEYNGYEVHILAYFIDIYNTLLLEMLNRIRDARIERTKYIIEELQKLDINISQDEIELDKFVSIGRPHIAKVLVKKGISSGIKEAFRQYLAKGKPAYVDRYKVNYKESLKIIREAGGISVLAHPGEIYEGLSTERLIKEFKVYGLGGIEVFHPSHSNDEVSKFYNLAKKYGLSITGGSDFHGVLENSEPSIGLVGLNEALTNKFLRSNPKK